MRLTISFLVCAAAVCGWQQCRAATVPWQQVTSEHFVVYYTGADEFARDVLDRAEVYYKRIATELGYPRYQDFWTWDKRVKIYVYPDRASYQTATAQQHWSEGMADYQNKRIMSYAWNKGFVESLLPHEMAHLIFRDFVGFKGEVPLWLDEGVAQWAEEAKRPQVKEYARTLYENDSALSVTDMMKLDVRRVSSGEKVFVRSTRTKSGEPGVLFLSGDQLVNAYYMQAVSMVGFLLEKYSASDFATFCRNLRDGDSFEEALRAAYPTHFRTVEEFESAWRKYISE